MSVFEVFLVGMRENTEQKNSENGRFSCNERLGKLKRPLDYDSLNRTHSHAITGTNTLQVRSIERCKGTQKHS